MIRSPLVPPLVAFVLIVSANALAQPTTRVSVDSNGVEGNGLSDSPTISADGRFVAFTSLASNLAPGDGDTSDDSFVHDRQTGATTLITLGPTGDHIRGYGAYISANGRFVAFVAALPNVPPNPLLCTHALIRDLQAETTEIATVASDGSLANSDARGDNGSTISLSADGRFVAFCSTATNLVAGGIRGQQVYLRDRTAGVTSLVSRSLSGSGADRPCTAPSVSDDGRFVSFESDSNNIVPNDVSSSLDVFVADMSTGSVRAVTSDSPGVPYNQNGRHACISGNGRFVAFTSLSPNLVPGDTNRQPDVFVQDLQTGETTRVDVDSNGAQALGTSFQTFPTPSEDGSIVAFWSSAWDLVSDDTNGTGDLFVHDRRDGTTTRVSLTSSGGQASAIGRNFIRSFAISADGGTVAFVSDTPNVVAGDTNGVADVFVRSTVELASVVPTIGSEAGGDLVRITGAHFGDAGATSVRFGNATATLVDVTPSMILARTPPGTGQVEVRVERGGATSATAMSFTYIAPDVIARWGNVNQGRGDREDVLLVNSITGDAMTREIAVALQQPLQCVLLTPSSRQAARYVLYLWGRAPTAATRTRLPGGVGSMVLAPRFLGGLSPIVWNTLGHRAVLGAPTYASRVAPTVVFRSPAPATLITLTLQGIIEDDGSQSATGLSVTNAVILRVH
ncbi:MAG: IPT/TIG domain-containing protein [Planctomycetes bacterium]|nr:IPT/TIG domain-containing protein [Planctomycetota bacterium]MBI3844775.1 IPT/TIG domain-containing protein [Planctomycetota bacterium]